MKNKFDLKNMKDKVVCELKNYPNLDAKIASIALDILEAEENIRIAGTTFNSIGSTANNSSVVESDVLRIIDTVNRLKYEKIRLENKKKKIDLALSVLDDDYKKMVQMHYFQKKSWVEVGMSIQRGPDYCTKVFKNKICGQIGDILFN